MLIGQYTHELDPKKRLTLPAKWRSALGKKLVITAGLDTSLFIFSIKEWMVIAERLASQSLGSKESRSFNRFLLANAFEVDCDAQGRILIPEHLKALGHLESKVVLAGMFKRIEVWDEARFKQSLEKSEQEADTIASKLSDLGIL